MQKDVFVSFLLEGLLQGLKLFPLILDCFVLVSYSRFRLDQLTESLLFSLGLGLDASFESLYPIEECSDTFIEMTLELILPRWVFGFFQCAFRALDFRCDLKILLLSFGEFTWILLPH